jgi:hypothetical protein
MGPDLTRGNWPTVNWISLQKREDTDKNK